ncbi:PepSY domain-containing protein [Stappia sp.]|uniref:PepSY domain-containing protein n=1 Tax=Stappia sp. TaxID=1870903 RepID=UPI0032D96DD7
MKTLPVLALLTLLLPAFATSALADRDDHDRARAALERGEVLPLSQLLARIEAEFGGRVIEIEFERDDGRFVYEFEIVSADGRLAEVTVDAATGAILEREFDDDDDDHDRGWDD